MLTMKKRRFKTKPTGRPPRTEEDILEIIKRRTVRHHSGCVLWTGTPASTGYARMYFGGKEVLLHKFVLEKKLGRKLGEGEVTRHKCDVKLCINEDHLESGSPADNARDASERWRYVVGTKNNMAVLKEREVMAIFSDPRPTRKIARDYGVAQGTVCGIKNGLTWNHITKLPRRRIISSRNV